MAPTLYMVPLCPPVRSVQITAKAIGLQLQEKQIDLTKEEQLKPEYVKMNPQHTVPTLVDEDGFVLWDSHAINTYLVSKYGKNDTLYPKDLKKRAVVDQRLHFDSGVAFATFVRTVHQVLREEKNSLDDKDVENYNRVYAFLEEFLQDGKPWVAGDSLTVADYNLYATITACNLMVSIDAEKYPKVVAWLKKVDGLPEADVSKNGLVLFNEFMKSKFAC